MSFKEVIMRPLRLAGFLLKVAGQLLLSLLTSP